MRPLTRDRYLTGHELERLMSAVRERKHPNQPRDYALLAILANTGIRPEEARALRRRDVCPHARPPHILLAREKKPHGPYPVNKLVIHRRVAKVIARYVAQMKDTNRDAMLFPFTKRQSRRIFHYYSALAGLPATFRIYALRHGVGIRLWRAKKDLRLIHGIMGHVRLKASAEYEHIAPDVLAAALTGSAPTT